MPFHPVIRLLQPVKKPAHVTAIFQINGIYISCVLDYYSLDLCTNKFLTRCIVWVRKQIDYTNCVDKILLDSWKHHILQGKHLIGRALWFFKQGLWCFCIYFMGINKVRLLRLFEMRLLLLILSKCLHVIAVGFLPISTAIFAKNSFICNYVYLDRFKKIISDVT